MGVTATVAVVARIRGWLIGVEGSSEVGETTVVDGTLTDVTADTRAAVQPISMPMWLLAGILERRSC